MDRATEALTPLTDGSFVLHVMWRERLRPPPPEGLVYRPKIGFFRFPRDLSRMDSLGWYDGGLPQMYLEIGGRRVYSVVPFPTHARLAAQVAPYRIYVGTGESWEIHMYSEGGTLSRIIRRTDPLESITPSDFAAAKERVAEGWPDHPMFNRAEHRRVLDAMPPQSHYPAFHDLLVDTDGYLWAGDRAGVYHIFDTSGRWLGGMHLPGKALDIGRDYVLIHASDDLGVERLHVFELRRHNKR
jgi:hypothetical protein